MSLIDALGRSIMAICSSLTGVRSAGTITVTATAGQSFDLSRNTWLWPVINGQIDPGMTYKVGAGPNDDESWTITDAGVNVDAISNIGGTRFNIADATAFRFFPPVPNVASAVANGAFTGGSDNDLFGSLRDMALFENAISADMTLELNRSTTRALPCMLVTWMSSEPADGSATTQVSRATRMNRQSVLYRHLYQLSVIVEKHENRGVRDEEGFCILDAVSTLLTDRHSIDGYPISNPSGIQILRMWRETPSRDRHKRVNIYHLTIGLVAGLVTQDSRTYDDWLLSLLNVPIRPTQGDDNLVVEDVLIDMRPTP